MSHKPLPDLINAFLDAGLILTRVYEPGDRPVPYTLAITARTPA
ncbi:hypothetical protein [Nonomuraea sp. SBT364]|nr:hypothetical protein [Nonomuraea sp. SBT364]